MKPWRFDDWQLAEPIYLWLLLIPLLVLMLRRFRGGRALVLPYVSHWVRPTGIRHSSWRVLALLLALVILIIAMARPQKVQDKESRQVEGYDIMLAIDLSESMLQEDYSVGGQRVNRLQAIKPVIEAFINRRKSDRIGIVVFGDMAFTLAPLTFDHDWLRRQTERLFAGVAGKNTAIGDGLGVALSRLEQADRLEAGKRQGAFVVLLTDGQNNRGALAPLDSAEIARRRGIPVYTIGAGSERRVGLFGLGPRMGGSLDEETLRRIAQLTGGRYFRAADSNTVAEAFAAIDQAEKIEFEATSYLLTEDIFAPLLYGGLTLSGLVAVSLLWRNGGEVVS